MVYAIQSSQLPVSCVFFELLHLSFRTGTRMRFPCLTGLYKKNREGQLHAVTLCKKERLVVCCRRAIDYPGPFSANLWIWLYQCAFRGHAGGCRDVNLADWTAAGDIQSWLDYLQPDYGDLC